MDYDKDSDVLIAIRDIINDYLYKERRKQRDKDKKCLGNLADMLLVAARERKKNSSAACSDCIYADYCDITYAQNNICLALHLAAIRLCEAIPYAQ